MNTNMHTNNEDTIERQSEHYEYEVEKTMLYDKDGNATPFFGTRRKDTMQCLGVVSNRYGIVQNRDLFGSAENCFKQLNLGNHKSKFIVTHDGSRAHAIYDFTDKVIKTAKGDNLTLRLKISNSFDGTIGASFQVGLFRIVCSNGLAVPHGRTVGVMKKHTMSVNVDFFQRAIEESLADNEKSLYVFNRMSELTITQRQGHNALANMAKRGVLSERLANAIGGIWDAPRYKEDSDRTVYNLYNAATQHLTHEVSSKRFDLSERSNSGVLRVLATEGLSKESKLWEFTETASLN